MVMVKKRDICEQCAAKIVFLWIKSLTAKHLGRQKKLTWTHITTSEADSTLAQAVFKDVAE